MFEAIHSSYFDIEHIIKKQKAPTSGTDLCKYQLHGFDDEDFLLLARLLRGNGKEAHERLTAELPVQECKALAVFLGNALGDALGAHTEFMEINPKRVILKDKWEDLINSGQISGDRTNLGIVTDDCSMARCLADSILANDFEFNGIDLRYRFLLWWHFGYNNTSQEQRSFGLGGNISVSFQRFYSEQTEYTSKKKGNMSGNGSIMRNGPVPIAFCNAPLEQALLFAEQQSMSTHDGDEAADCCRLLTFIVIKLLHYQGTDPKRDILENQIKEFQSQTTGCYFMANSKQEPEENLPLYDQNVNRSTKDRNWNWRADFAPSPTRASKMPGYFGSYAMDGLYTALHIVYHTSSFKETLFTAANWGGDADSIAAIAGQIAGAMYGLDAEVLELYQQRMRPFDQYSTFVKARKLYHRRAIATTFRYEKLPPKVQQTTRHAALQRLANGAQALTVAQVVGLFQILYGSNKKKFIGLQKCLSDDDRESAQSLLQAITFAAQHALNTQLPERLPLLMQKVAGEIALTRGQIAAILAQMLFGGTVEQHGDFPPEHDMLFWLNNDFFTNRTKLLCLASYFNAIEQRSDREQFLNEQKVHFVRNVSAQKEIPQQTKLCAASVDGKQSIEDYEDGLMADFANQYIGGGVLGAGCVQEEIMFAVRPECLVSCLLCERMLDNEAIIIIGALQYAEYRGYAGRFEFVRRRDTRREEQVLHAGRTAIVAIDAIPFTVRNSQFEFKPDVIERDLFKAISGFEGCKLLNDEQPKRLPVITGNWGCGAFNGSPQLKFVIQWIAASVCQRELIYCSYHDQRITPDVEVLIKHWTARTAQELLNALQAYANLDSRINIPDLFSYLKSYRFEKK